MELSSERRVVTGLYCHFSNAITSRLCAFTSISSLFYVCVVVRIVMIGRCTWVLFRLLSIWIYLSLLKAVLNGRIAHNIFIVISCYIERIDGIFVGNICI